MKWQMDIEYEVDDRFFVRQVRVEADNLEDAKLIVQGAYGNWEKGEDGFLVPDDSLTFLNIDEVTPLTKLTLKPTLIGRI